MNEENLAPLDRIREVIEQMIPFNRTLGVQVRALRRGVAETSVPKREDFVGDFTRPALHGGVLSALCDLTGGGAVFTQVGMSDRVSTIDLLVDYLRPAPLATIVCRAEVVRIGSRVALVQMACFAEGDEAHLIATGRGAYNIKRGPAGSLGLLGA